MRREGRFRVWRPKNICECGHPLDIFHAGFRACTADGCDCKKYGRKGAPKKIHAKNQMHRGVKFDSGLESRVMADLYRQMEAGEIKDIQRQFKIEIYVNGYKITTHYMDFRVEYPDGTIELIEVKGRDTPTWLVNRRLVEAVYLVDNPGVKYRILR